LSDVLIAKLVPRPCDLPTLWCTESIACNISTLIRDNNAGCYWNVCFVLGYHCSHWRAERELNVESTINVISRCHYLIWRRTLNTNFCSVQNELAVVSIMHIVSRTICAWYNCMTFLSSCCHTMNNFSVKQLITVTSK